MQGDALTMKNAVKKEILPSKGGAVKRQKTKYVMTRADRIRSMSDEAMAEKMKYAYGCPVNGDCIKMSGNCKACWLDWLHQPAEGETGK